MGNRWHGQLCACAASLSPVAPTEYHSPTENRRYFRAICLLLNPGVAVQAGCNTIALQAQKAGAEHDGIATGDSDRREHSATRAKK